MIQRPLAMIACVLLVPAFAAAEPPTPPPSAGEQVEITPEMEALLRQFVPADSAFGEEADLNVARSLAEDAVALSDRKVPRFLHTLARVQHLAGEHEQAAATQREALAVATDEDPADILEAALAEYEAAAK
ncbi:MAG: hypothetical protein AAF743_11645 [Planctomycetota bacterium]